MYPNIYKIYVAMQMWFIQRIGLGPVWVKKTGIEITSIYPMSSVNSLEICLILIMNAT